jgi:hypothetical protein
VIVSLPSDVRRACPGGADRPLRLGDAPRGVFHEKAPNCKAARAACPYRLLVDRRWVSVPESSIRTLKEPIVGSVHEGVPPLRRCTLYNGLEGSGRYNAVTDNGG